MKIKFHVDFFEFVPSHIRISMVVVVFRTIFFPLPSIFARSLARSLACSSLHLSSKCRLSRFASVALMAYYNSGYTHIASVCEWMLF